MAKSILLFADKLTPFFGGMEVHGKYFIESYQTSANYSLKAIITKDLLGNDIIIQGEESKAITLLDFGKYFAWSPDIVFFNSGKWIEELELIRSLFPSAQLVYRTGGNEIIKAPLVNQTIFKHSERQLYWANQINKYIDILITNSLFTENRLKDIGINPKIFRRCVGGVDYNYIRSNEKKTNNCMNKVFLCASRFVPYKNHDLIIEVFNQIKKNGLNFTLNLVGDGQLFESVKKKVYDFGLQDCVHMLGSRSNHQVIDEMIRSDFFIQLSSEYKTEVMGGTYLHAEGMGRSILEAISCGTHIISSSTGAISEIVNSENGTLVDLQNFDSIVRNIEGLIVKPTITRNPTDKYSWNNYFKMYNDIFNEK
jgi:glycosyltransferase involved in cell wall biosynthesis